MTSYVSLLDKIEQAEFERDRAVQFHDFKKAYALDDAIAEARTSYGNTFEMLYQTGKLARLMQKL